MFVIATFILNFFLLLRYIRFHIQGTLKAHVCRVNIYKNEQETDSIGLSGQIQDVTQEALQMVATGINTTCDEISSFGLYNYTKPHALQTKDCELSWHAPDGTVLGHGDFLIRQVCDTGIRLIARCFNTHASGLKEFVYNVVNSTISPPDASETAEEQAGFGGSSTSISTISVTVSLVVFVGVLCAFVCYRRRKKVKGWWTKMYNGVFGRASENTVL
ncbi:uncharacterized protein LOC132842161 isoform X2 [Tachysurus vachellii]|uniref:uncharacterized protein LOC132842161 isoform X2 n=1 Tax=Tachysurus vachellii TaxID=175792 RepID=UPI00296B36B1|nr:uncharacterized protein LOC132842161 isoform X2 [Tachysurus vachellii]